MKCTVEKRNGVQICHKMGGNKTNQLSSYPKVRCDARYDQKLACRLYFHFRRLTSK
jgi:hypothetical protein